MKQTLRMGLNDDVVLALRRLVRGTCVEGLTVLDCVPMGHKLAVRPIDAGAPVRFYDGLSMGIATRDIVPGEHVHQHNLRSAVSWEFLPWSRPDFSSWSPPVEVERSSFLGFARQIAGKRRVGIRNDVWVLPAVSCTKHQCEQIAQWGRAFVADRAEYSSITGIHVLSHSFGCSEGEHALKNFTQPALLGHVANPNAGAILAIGLGCEENVNFSQIVSDAGLSDPRRFRHFALHDFDSLRFEDPVEQGKHLLKAALQDAAECRREVCSVRELTIGVKCGASGPFSGMTGNPVLGGVSDIFVAQGSTVLITEVPEFFGAVEAVLARASTRELHSEMICRFLRYRDYLIEAGIEVSSNPSPGNIEAGLTTIEQKSAGAVKKAGSGPVVDFARYGERVSPAKGGVVIVYGPGGDETAVTTLQASGAVMIPWVTQVGTPAGTYSPTPKIFAVSDIARKFPFWCDFDAGILLREGVTFREVVSSLYSELLDIAEGKLTKNEITGSRSISLWSKISL